MAVDPKKVAAMAKRSNADKPKPKFGKPGGGGPPPGPGGNVGKKGAPPPEDVDMDDEADEPEEHDEDEEMAVKVAARVLSGDVDEDVAQAVSGYDAEADGDIPLQIEDEALWARAKSAVEKAGGEYEDITLVICAVYKELGGAFSDEG